MKKQLFLMTIMAGAICLTSCEQKQGPDVPPTPQDSTKITVNPHEVVLTAEEPSVRLAATLDPADPTATIVWSSSDTTVATVTSRGYVEATGYGECYIYASVGKAKDSCHIQVKSFLESLTFTNVAFYSPDTTTALVDPTTGEFITDTITSSDGTKYVCYIIEGTMLVFSDGIYINNSAKYDGAEQGAIIEINAPMYYGTEYLNPEEGAVRFALGKWLITSDPKADRECAPAQIDENEYVKQMKSAIEAILAEDNYSQYLKAAGATVTGPVVEVLEYNAEGEGYYSSYIPSALCEEGEFIVGDPSEVSNYMRKLDYSEVTYKAFAMDTVFGSSLVTGLNLGYNEETDEIFFNDEKVHFDESITSIYGTKSAKIAARRPISETAILNDNDMANLEKQIKDKNIRVIRVK